jgi:hypothetical protein
MRTTGGGLTRIVFGVGLVGSSLLVGCSGGDGEERADTRGVGFEEVSMTGIPGYAPYPAGDCDPGAYRSTSKVVAATRELSWDRCWPAPGGAAWNRQTGVRVLDAAAFHAVVEAVQNLHETEDRTSCAVDAGSLLVDVKKATVTELFADDLLSGCPRSEHEGRKFADLEGLSKALSPEQD